MFLRKLFLFFSGSLCQKLFEPVKLILMYHSINASGFYLCTKETKFFEHLSYLKEHQFQFITLKQLIYWLEGKLSIGKRAVVVTFDDGYEDNLTGALPILEQFGCPAVIFVSFDNHPHLKKLTTSQIKLLSEHPLITLGAHTLSHIQLTKCSPDEAYREIKLSKEKLQQITGKEVEFFAYPKGMVNSVIVDFVKDLGFKGACGSRCATIKPTDNPYLLSRIFMYNTTFELVGLFSPAIDIYENIKKYAKF